MDCRPAGYLDAETIIGFDDVARADRGRVNFIHKNISSRNCHVALFEGRVVGYGVLEYSFFDHGFVSMLYVDQDFQRRGVGEALMCHMRRVCRTDRLFTTTDESNVAMQGLLEKIGFEPSGTIRNIDDGAAHLLYFARSAGSRRG